LSKKSDMITYLWYSICLSMHRSFLSTTSLSDLALLWLLLTATLSDYAAKLISLKVGEGEKSLVIVIAFCMSTQNPSTFSAFFC
jgi:hypothetical protein